MKLIERIYKRIDLFDTPLIIGLDPDLDLIPTLFTEYDSVFDTLYNYNKCIIDLVANKVSAVKLQVAFYEIYGEDGIRAFKHSIDYAKQKGLITIVDAKRNDIGNTAQKYADAYIGAEASLYGFKADMLTVTPFLGFETLNPFINNCNKYDKGIFVLVKTSNLDADTIQGSIKDEDSVCSKLVSYISDNYSDKDEIGVVVGATHPQEMKEIRKKLPYSLFLVPGFGEQGGSIQDIENAFYDVNRGALINSSRGILYAYLHEYNKDISLDEYKFSLIDTIDKSKQDIRKIWEK